MRRQDQCTGRRTRVVAFAVVIVQFLFTQHSGLSTRNLLFAAEYNESTGVNTRRGDPSPTAAGSNVDDYRFQQDQIYITPDTGVVKVLRVNQKNLVNDFVTEMIPVHNVSVREIRNLMRQVCGAEGGRAEVIRDKNKKENFVQVICPPFQLPYIRKALAALDKPWVTVVADGATSAYYSARFRDIRAINQVAEVPAGEGESEVDLANNSVYRWDEPYRTEAYLRGATVSDVPVNQVLLDLKIYEINVTNDTKLGLDYIAWKNGPGRNLGEFILSGMENHETFHNVSSIYNPIFPRLVNPGPRDLRVATEFTADEVSGFANYLLTAAYLDFLSAKGRAKVLASTQLLATSGQGRNAGTSPARFEAVDDIAGFVVNPNDPGVNQGLGARPSRLTTTHGTLTLDPATSRPIRDEDGNPRFTYNNTPKTVDTPVHNRTLNYSLQGKTGIFLEVIPHVGLESCELEVTAGASSVAGNGPDGLPILAQRTLATQLTVPNGRPIVLAGLSRKTRINDSARMPILGKIPILGYLAGGETGAQRETQVVFVLTPTIISGSESAITMGAQARDVIAAAKGTKPFSPPANRLGFDQWLLGNESPAP
jgi:Flp pilus assembly secretin CpaC